MVIREINASDLERVLQILSQLSPSSSDNSEILDVLNNLLNNNDHYVNVCEVDGRVVATSHLYAQPNLSHNGKPRGRIENVVVDYHFRGRGIGRALIEDALRKADERKCYKVTLDCSPQNAVFYEKLGFRKTGEVEMRIDL